MGDQLAVNLCEALSEQTSLNCLTVIISGRIGNLGATLLSRCVQNNRTLHSLVLRVGCVPKNWKAVIRPLEFCKSWRSLQLQPDPCAVGQDEERLERETILIHRAKGQLRDRLFE